MNEHHQKKNKELHASGIDTSNKTLHFFTTFFTKKLFVEGYVYKNIRKWTKNIDIFGFERIFFPVLIMENHWSLAVVNIKKKYIQMCDSKKCYNGSRDTQDKLTSSRRISRELSHIGVAIAQTRF